MKDSVSHWIDEAAAASRYFTADDVWTAIAEKRAQLWLAWSDIPEAVCVTQIEATSKGKHCHIWIMVGQNMQGWHHLMNDLETWAKREGCTMMRHEARPGWSRVLKTYGYECPHLILEKMI